VWSLDESDSFSKCNGLCTWAFSTRDFLSFQALGNDRLLPPAGSRFPGFLGLVFFLSRLPDELFFEKKCHLIFLIRQNSPGVRKGDLQSWLISFFSMIPVCDGFSLFKTSAENRPFRSSICTSPPPPRTTDSLLFESCLFPQTTLSLGSDTPPFPWKAFPNNVSELESLPLRKMVTSLEPSEPSFFYPPRPLYLNLNFFRA